MKYKFSDVCDVINGRAYSQEELLDKGKYRVLRVGNFFTRDKWYFSDLELEENKYCNEGDLLFAWSASFGPKIWHGEKVIYHYHIWKLLPKTGIADKTYLYFWLLFSTDKLLAGNHGSVMAHMTKGEMENREIILPPLPTQKKIAAILSALDAKIENNNAINRNLEQQAQALFKSWFVDFEPFGGKMPDGWREESIYSVAKIVYGAPFKSSLFNLEKEGRPIVRIRDLKGQNLTTYTTEILEKEYIIKPGDIVVGMDGEFRPYIWGNDNALLNQRVCVFKPNSVESSFFVYFTILPQLDFIERTEAATTVIHIGKSDFDTFLSVIPESSIMNNFNKLTYPMYEMIVKNQIENTRLAALRDTLLPKLMSGEIKV